MNTQRKFRHTIIALLGSDLHPDMTGWLSSRGGVMGKLIGNVRLGWVD